MDAITELDDGIINEAAGEPSADALRRAKNGRKTILYKFAAAAAALAVTVGGIFMITRKPAQNTPGTDAAETQGIVTGGPVDSGAWQAKALASPVYPEEMTWQEERDNPLVQSPAQARWINGRDTAELYRGFFADTMLLLLSDQNEESAVMSPVNIFMATAMLAEITDGETRQEILNTLGVKDIEQLRDQAAKIWGLCYKDDGREKTVLGNSLWLNNGLQYRQSTVQQLADSYYASAFMGEMGSDSYNSLLQRWLNDMTGGLLAEQVKGIELPADTALALISTVLHETKWGDEFSKDNTKPGTFHSPAGDVEAEFMYSYHDTTTLFTADKYRFIQKGTRQGRVLFFLPNEGTSVSEMMQEESFRTLLSYPFKGDDYFVLDPADGFFHSTTNRGITGSFAWINLTVPKLDITYQQDLTAALQALGIKTAFTAEKADYTPITDEPGVYLQKAEQGTRLIMDEEGISAASYVEYLAGEPLLDTEVDMVFDRPFFMLVLGTNDVPLFAGVVNVP